MKTPVHERIIRAAVFSVGLLMILFAAGCATGARPVPDFKLPATADAGLPGAGPVTHGDWFQRFWRDRRQAFARAARQDRGAVVFLGDSITHGWGDDLGGNFPGVRVANRGIAGDTSRGVLIRLPEDVLILRPRAVVLLIGTNDIDQGAAPETIAPNIRLILASLHRQNSRMPVVLCSVFPSSATKRRPAASIKALNKSLVSVAAENPQVIWLDVWPAFANGEGDARPEEFPDLLHPNALGYAKWAAALRTALPVLYPPAMKTKPRSSPARKAARTRCARGYILICPGFFGQRCHLL
jgi:lysophospholipase L1-like esterase